MDEGFLYCMSNVSMPGLFKIGFTQRTPEERLREANKPDTWKATPFKIEFAKKVFNAKNKEKTLHRLLEQYADRIHPRREFWKVSTEEISAFFDLMDGEMWDPKKNSDALVDSDKDSDEDDSEDEIPQEKEPRGCRDMTKCFQNGQRIRHKIGINKIWMGYYDFETNKIHCQGNSYDSLSGLAKAHYRVEKPERKTNTANGWRECECEVDGKWVSTFCL